MSYQGHTDECESILHALTEDENKDKILEYITVNICELDVLNEDHFLRKTENYNDISTYFIDQRKQSRRTRTDEDDFYIDYNYVTITSKSPLEIYKMISVSLGSNLTPHDILMYFSNLSRTYIETGDYIMETVDGKTKLVRSKYVKQNRRKQVINHGKNVVNNRPSLEISVAYLKQKLPHILGDNLIEDLTCISVL